MTASDWISLAGVVVSILVPSLGFVYATLRNRIVEANNRAEEIGKKSDAHIDVIGRKLDEVRADVAAFKLLVVKEYASMEHLRDLDDRMTKAVQEIKVDLRLGLDTILKQIEFRRSEGQK